jgi:predicted ester cyclase
MPSEENKTLYRRIYDIILNKQDLSIIDEVISPEYIYHDPHNILNGPDELKHGMSAYFTAGPDLQFTVDEIIGEGDMVAKRWKAVFTHKGELMGVPPTGKKVIFTGMSFARFANGKLVEEWEAADYLGLMQQIGAIPSD